MILIFINRFARKGRPPPGFEIIEPTLDVLERELRDSEFVSVLNPPALKKSECDGLIFFLLLVYYFVGNLNVILNTTSRS
jgi:hypothetical protein